MKEVWIIVAYNSEGESWITKRFGTYEEIKQRLMEIINEDRVVDEDNWDMGTEDESDLYEEVNNGLAGYNNFVSYSINYMAYPVNNIPEDK